MYAQNNVCMYMLYLSSLIKYKWNEHWLRLHLSSWYVENAYSKWSIADGLTYMHTSVYSVNVAFFYRNMFTWQIIDLLHFYQYFVCLKRLVIYYVHT